MGVSVSDKISHRAKIISPNGEVFPLCDKAHKIIDLSKESWTLRDNEVTCKKCLDILKPKTL